MDSHAAPLIVHVVFSFRVGGLENGMVNLINRLPAGLFRHVIVAMTDADPVFFGRIQRPDVALVELHKTPGPGLLLVPRMVKLLRELRPAVVHTRNLAALEMSLAAWLAGVPVRIHGEHGRDVDDPLGEQSKPRWVRRAYSPFVTQYIALSRELENYLSRRVGIAEKRIRVVCNGVDARRFMPVEHEREVLPGSPFDDPALCVVGTVGRLQAVKDQATLVRAFARLVHSEGFAALRLVIVGEGASRGVIEELVRSEGIGGKVWLAGERSDIPAVMRSFDIFALPSIAEGISNTVLEAMATGLPVVATAVGGNPELVEDGVTGTLVPAGDPAVLADSLAAYASDPERIRAHGRAARSRIESEFSLDAMVRRYQAIYEQGLDAADLRVRA